LSDSTCPETRQHDRPVEAPSACTCNKGNTVIDDRETANVAEPEAQSSNPQSGNEEAPTDATSDSTSGDETLSNSTNPPGSAAADEGRSEEVNPIARAESSLVEGRRQFGLKKSASATAAAHAYVFWRECASPQADPNARNWFDRKIDAWRTSVKTQNDEMKSDWKIVRSLDDGTLPEDHALHKEPENSAWRVKLAKLAHLTKADFEKRRKVTIKKEDKKDPERFLAAVKLVFEIDKRADATNATRYATVLRWVHARFKGEESPTAEQIVAAITECGFEQVIKDHRAAEKKSKPKKENAPSQGDLATDANQNDEPEDNFGGFSLDSVSIQIKLPEGVGPLPIGAISLHGRLRDDGVLELAAYEKMSDLKIADLFGRLSDEASLPEAEAGSIASEADEALEDEEN